MRSICNRAIVVLLSLLVTTSNVFAASPQTVGDCGRQTTVTKGGAIAGTGAGCTAGLKCLALAEPVSIVLCMLVACAAGAAAGAGVGAATDEIIETTNCAGSAWQTTDRRHWSVYWDAESASEARTKAERNCRKRGKGKCHEGVTFRYCAAPAYGTNAHGRKEYVWAQGFDASLAASSAVALCKKRGLANCRYYHRSYCNEN